ncbi:MAG: hypothetical protein KKG59_03740 [Nanoarchaeota archaeon]|nr:hypothetical protein [Nanoarchaeota archaeon]
MKSLYAIILGSALAAGAANADIILDGDTSDVTGNLRGSNSTTQTIPQSGITTYIEGGITVELPYEPRGPWKVEYQNALEMANKRGGVRFTFWDQDFGEGLDVITEFCRLSDGTPTSGVGKRYWRMQVRDGQNLIGLAGRLSQFTTRRVTWEDLYEANKAVIGDDPHHIEPGQTFTYGADFQTPREQRDEANLHKIREL